MLQAIRQLNLQLMEERRFQAARLELDDFSGEA
jgi:hypothetical protein